MHYGDDLQGKFGTNRVGHNTPASGNYHTPNRLVVSLKGVWFYGVRCGDLSLAKYGIVVEGLGLICSGVSETD